LEKGSIKVKTHLLILARRRHMKKAFFAVLMLTMIIFLISPVSSDARGGYWGWRGGWWGPWPLAVGGAVVVAPYYAPYYYWPYYAPGVVVVPEQPPLYLQRSPAEPQAAADRYFVYPRQGQSAELQAKDRYDCHSWAVGQTRYDPTQSMAGVPDAQLNQLRSDYQRAMAACLDGRGYTMK
jgi:hypothetical protein